MLTKIGKGAKAFASGVAAGLAYLIGVWGEQATVSEAKPMLRERLLRLRSFLDVVAPPDVGGPLLVVPDTSVLIDDADVAHYPSVLDVAELDIYLMPAVLSELDALKEVFGDHPVQVRASSKGNYVSVTARIEMHSSDEVIDIYQAAGQVEGVISL